MNSMKPKPLRPVGSDHRRSGGAAGDERAAHLPEVILPDFPQLAPMMVVLTRSILRRRRLRPIRLHPER